MNNVIFTLVQRGLGWNIFRWAFVHLDLAVFSAFKLATQAIFDLANLTLFDDEFFEAFTDRIYILVGIFMLFRVTIAMLGYLIDPDKISDKSEGLSKIISRTIISICMLAGLPFVWNLLFGKIVGDKTLNDIMLETIPRIIIGKNTDQKTVSEEADSISQDITWKVYSVVFHNYDDTGIKDCGSDVCTMDWAADHVNDPGNSNAEYRYYYLPLIGTAIGVVMCIAMISIAIDVAIRIFKLVILRMIAPIPILGYILPKSKKGDLFGNWVKTLIMTWADLFIKLGIIYFVLFMIDEIILKNTIDLNSLVGLRKGAVIVFIIVGLLFFAKDAPKFVTDLLGIKETKGFGFGKALTAGAIGAGVIGSGVAGVGSSVAATHANGKKMHPGNVLKAAGAGIFGAGAGLVTGVGAAVGAKDHNTKAAFDAMNKRNAAALTAGRTGSTFFGRTNANLSKLFTGETAADRDAAKLAKFESEATAKKQLFDYIMDKGAKAGSQTSVSTNRQVGVDANGNAINRMVKTSYSSFNSAYQNAIQNGSNTFSIFNEATGQNEIFETNNSATGKFLGDLQEASATEWSSNNSTDETLQTYERVAGVSNGSYTSTGIKADYKNAERDAFDFKNSSRAKQNKANAGSSK